MAEGTKNGADFTEKDRNANKEEETKNLKAAIELFKSNGEVINKKLNELRVEYDGDRKDLDLQGSENAEGIKQNMFGLMNEINKRDDLKKAMTETRKRSVQQNRGTGTEFTGQNCNENIENEIPSKLPKLSHGVQEPDQKACKFLFFIRKRCTNSKLSCYMKKKEAKRKWGQKVGILEFSNQEVKKNMKMLRLEHGHWDHYLEIPAKFEDHVEVLNGIKKMYNLKKLKETLEEPDQFNDHTKGDCKWMNKLNVKWKDSDRSVLSIVLHDVEDKGVTKNDVYEKQERTNQLDKKSEALEELIYNQNEQMKSQLVKLRAMVRRNQTEGRVKDSKETTTEEEGELTMVGGVASSDKLPDTENGTDGIEADMVHHCGSYRSFGSK